MAFPARWLLLCAIAPAFTLGCRASIAARAGETSDASPPPPPEGACVDAGTAPGPGPGCTSGTTTGTCDGALATAIPPGPVVTIAAGAGCPPAPRGGPVTAGNYVLVAETVYGANRPDALGRPGDTIQAELNVTCDEYTLTNAVARSAGNESGASSSCGRLVPQVVSLVALSSGAPGPDPGVPLPNEAPYTATSSTLTIVKTTPYADTSTGTTVGWTTVVDDYVVAASNVAARPPPATSTPANPPARDPRCPAGPPAPNAPCDPVTGQPLECEYGGDASGQCTAVARCALQPDGSFAFDVRSDVNCVVSDPSCPASYGAVPMMDGGYVQSGSVSDGGGCTRVTTVICSYPEGVCVCTAPASSATCTCRARSEVSTESGDGTACPAKRPLAGDSCATEGAWCLYDGACGSISLGPSMACMGGYWEPNEAMFGCPAMACLP